MKKNIFFPLCLVIFFVVPSLSSAECTHIGGFSHFSVEGANTVTLFSRSTPVVRFDVQGCSVQPGSKIELIKSDICDGDEIMIDGSKCTIMEIKPFGNHQSPKQITLPNMGESFSTFYGFPEEIFYVDGKYLNLSFRKESSRGNGIYFFGLERSPSRTFFKEMAWEEEV